MHDTLIGPFAQIVTMASLPPKGHLEDSDLAIIPEGGVVVKDGKIAAIGKFQELKQGNHKLIEISHPAVLFPGIIDAHTHICFGGSRAADYALRLTGMSYQEIAARGGGILDTVRKTREASQETLVSTMLERLSFLLQLGVTTCEVKSGYGLDIENELKMLYAIAEASQKQPIALISTCLAAHKTPEEFSSPSEYLSLLIQELLPKLKEQSLTNRIDIFVEQHAFSIEEARHYLQAAKAMGFSLCLHADQFSRGGCLLAAEVGAVTAEHLEVSTEKDFEALRKGNVIPIVLPGASLGLGMPFAKAHSMLDHGLPLVIASDWNPGSAPMGNLLLQAALLGAAERLTMAETWAAITTRAAKALQLHDRGTLEVGMRADMIAFPCSDYREVLYKQGSMTPTEVFIKGRRKS